MGLIVSRLVTGCGKINQCQDSTKLTFNKVNSVRLLEYSAVSEEVLEILENTSISVCNLLEYFKNRKCNLRGIVKVGEAEYEVNISNIKYCDKKLKVYLEKNETIPVVCNKCISLEVFFCVKDTTMENAKKLMESNPNIKLSNKAMKLIKH